MFGFARTHLFILEERHISVKEWFYGSTPNSSLTKSPVLKPALGRTSGNTVPPLPTGRPRSIALRKQEHTRRQFFHGILPRVEQPHDETLVEENSWF